MRNYFLAVDSDHQVLGGGLYAVVQEDGMSLRYQCIVYRAS